MEISRSQGSSEASVRESNLQVDSLEALLNRLSHGDESTWFDVAVNVYKGLIYRGDAVHALIDCLRNHSIPRIQENFRVGDRHYWGPRLRDARQALIRAKLGMSVTYRGVFLPRRIYDPIAMLYPDPRAKV